MTERDMRYWVMKSEPESFSIEDLINSPDQIAPWEGVRNYQARNWLRDAMRVGEQAFFYHSNCKVPGIVGIMEVIRAGYPDPTAFDPESPYYNPKSDPERPRWYRIDVRHVRTLDRLISLEELKHDPELKDLPLVRRGNRLSIMPVTAAQWQFILKRERLRLD
jgi:predicted RNA-binding protein with PUA-like domain